MAITVSSHQFHCIWIEIIRPGRCGSSSDAESLAVSRTRNFQTSCFISVLVAVLSVSMIRFGYRETRLRYQLQRIKTQPTSASHRRSKFHGCCGEWLGRSRLIDRLVGTKVGRVIRSSGRLSTTRMPVAVGATGRRRFMRPRQPHKQASVHIPGPVVL